MQEKETRIIESFAKYAKNYDRYAFIQKTMAERLAVNLPNPLPAKILEIGCGTGIFTRHLLSYSGFNLILNDIAPAMIHTLKEQIKVPQNTKMIIGNAEKVRFPKVDLIIANAVFQWFENPKRSLIRFRKLLPSEGGLAFSTFGPKTLQELRQTAGIQSPTHLTPWNQWKNIFTGIEFKIHSAQKETRKIIFPSCLALIKNLQQSGTAPFRLLNSGQLRTLIRQYDQSFTNSQGVYSTWEMYYFFLKKTSY